MAKILSIQDNVISIGTDNGSIQEVRAADLTFVPHVGDQVEIFQTDEKTLVSKIEPVAANAPAGGININLQNTQTATAQPAMIPNGKVVNKVVYCVLAFFLGGIGVHKFYAGKTGMGIFMLLFCWTFIPAFIALIDFIVGLTKKADSNGNILI